VLAERSADYFDISVPSPYMLLVAPVKAERRLKADMSGFERGDDNMLQVISQARSDIPAVTHVDHTARIQTVDAQTHPVYHALLKAFEAITGDGLLVNTSFNVRGEPIVCSPQDAYRCFMRTHADLLVMEDFLVWRKDQPAAEVDEAWKQTYELD
jgi:carbamoyltransferase